MPRSAVYTGVHQQAETAYVDGGGHTCPGGLPVPALGKTTMNADATSMMWDFFVRHPLD